LEGVDLLRAGGEHDDVGRTQRADAASRLEAVHARKAHIERRHDRLARAVELEPFGAGAGGVDGESCLIQHFGDE